MHLHQPYRSPLGLGSIHNPITFHHSPNSESSEKHFVDHLTDLTRSDPASLSFSSDRRRAYFLVFYHLLESGGEPRELSPRVRELSLKGEELGSKESK